MIDSIVASGEASRSRPSAGQSRYCSRAKRYGSAWSSTRGRASRSSWSLDQPEAGPLEDLARMSLTQMEGNQRDPWRDLAALSRTRDDNDGRGRGLSSARRWLCHAGGAWRFPTNSAWHRRRWFAHLRRRKFISACEFGSRFYKEPPHRLNCMLTSPISGLSPSTGSCKVDARGDEEIGGGTGWNSKSATVGAAREAPQCGRCRIS
jgi:hypothetical protein